MIWTVILIVGGTLGIVMNVAEEVLVRVRASRGRKALLALEAKHNAMALPVSPIGGPAEGWECACGWLGLRRELVETQAGIRVCPTCGGSGGLRLESPRLDGSIEA
jgi:hypothetical protein